MYMYHTGSHQLLGLFAKPCLQKQKQLLFCPRQFADLLFPHWICMFKQVMQTLCGSFVVDTMTVLWNWADTAAQGLGLTHWLSSSHDVPMTSMTIQPRF